MGAFDDMQDQAQGLTYAKFVDPGTVYEGEVLAAAPISHPFDDDKPKVPCIHLKTDDLGIVSITCLNSDQIKKTILANPNVGDHMRMEYVELTPLKGGKTFKVFDVKVTPKGQKPAAAKAAQATDAPF